MLFLGNHEEAAVLDHPLIDRPHAVPTPGLDALAHRVVEDDGDVRLIYLELGAAFRFQFLLGEIRRNKSEVFARDTVSLRRVAVAAVRKCPLPHAARDHDNVAADLFPQVLLKDASIVDLDALDHEILLSLVRFWLSVFAGRRDDRTFSSTCSIWRSISP